MLFYLQLASFLCYESVEWKNENDSGDSCQSRRPEMLNKTKNETVLDSFQLKSSHARMSAIVKNISTYLPEEEETKSNFNRSQPDSVEVHHKVHELLSVCRDQIDNLAHSASPPGRAVYHQRLD